MDFPRPQISDKAVEVMLKIAQKLTDDDRGRYILTDVLSTSHSSQTQSSPTTRKMTNPASSPFRYLCEDMD
jgi:hypothetical protein